MKLFKSKRIVMKVMTTSVLCAMLLGNTFTAFALDSNGMISDPTTITAAMNNLKAVVQEATDMDLKNYPATYADNVEYALSVAQTITPNNTIDKINVTSLTLRVALDTLTIDLEKATIADMQAMVKAKKLTYEKLVNMYLARINLYDLHTVKLNSFAIINPNAILLAKESDAAVTADPSKATGMFGIPVLIKDNIGVAGVDGMPTTAGSIALAKNFTLQDSFLAGQLKKSGAIILGKANLSEFANFIASGMKSGYSTLHGQVLNPYLPGVLDVSGSSSGSGAGAAAALAAITIGTETSGSILSPSTNNSLVGLKPTVGLVSRHGIIPLSHSQDTAGPMGRNVSDVAALLTVMQGYDSEDIHINMGVDNEIAVDDSYLNSHMENYNDYLKKDGLKGKVLGVYSIPSTNQPDTYAAFQKAIQVLKDQGATIVYSSSNGGMSSELPSAPASKVLYYDFKQDINGYLTSQSNPIKASDNRTVIKSLQDVITYNSTHPDVLKYGQSILLESQSYDMTEGSPDYQTYLAQRAADIKYSRKNGINYLLDKYHLDGLIGLNGATTGIAAKAGYPSITVPAGYRTVDGSNGSPINLQFTGDAFTEEQLIQMGYAFEQATTARIAPGMAIKDQLKALIDDAAALKLNDKEYNTALAVYKSNFSTQREVDNSAKDLYNDLYGPKVLDFQDMGSLKVGETRQSVVSATYHDSLPAIITSGVYYMSSNTSVASVVYGSGEITALSAGETVISATYGEWKGLYHLLVEPAPISTPTPTPTPPPGTTSTTPILTASPTPTATPVSSATPTATDKPFFNEKVNLDVIKTLLEKANSAPAITFTDVPKDSPAAKTIELATKLGIVKGYADGSFHANATVTRAEFATMLVKALSLESTGSSSFKDTQGHWAADAIAALKSSGIINGYSDGSFKPNQSISKAEIAAMLSKVMNTTSASNLTKFSDVSGSWAEDAINELADSGIVKGAGDGSFKPNAKATRSESLLMIMRLLNVGLGLSLDIE